METVAALALVCAFATPGPDCSVTTALDVVRVPHVATVTECMMHGQALIAGTALRPGEGQYLKVVCERAHKVGEMPTSTVSR